MKKKEWFETWFDSKYYHLLYNNRDENEAKKFIDNLLNDLALNPSAAILDIGCGKGRHAIQIAKNGYNVVGLDISPESIEYAKKYETSDLSFYVHDMRKVFRINYFNAIFNLFTSFGYFKTMRENEAVLSNHYKGLRDNGIFVIDFMNSHRVIDNLVPEETIIKDEVTFDIKRVINNGFIEKTISFDVENKRYSFTESVYGFSEEQLKNMITEAGFTVKKCYGDYELNSFDKDSSSRLIIIAQK